MSATNRAPPTGREFEFSELEGVDEFSDHDLDDDDN